MTAHLPCNVLNLSGPRCLAASSRHGNSKAKSGERSGLLMHTKIIQGYAVAVFMQVV
jgi:hypothetical protein